MLRMTVVLLLHAVEFRLHTFYTMLHIVSTLHVDLRCCQAVFNKANLIVL